MLPVQEPGMGLSLPTASLHALLCSGHIQRAWSHRTLSPPWGLRFLICGSAWNFLANRHDLQPWPRLFLMAGPLSDLRPLYPSPVLPGPRETRRESDCPSDHNEGNGVSAPESATIASH